MAKRVSYNNEKDRNRDENKGNVSSTEGQELNPNDFEIVDGILIARRKKMKDDKEDSIK